MLEKLKKNAWVEIEIHEGRKREIRRIFETLGYFVEKLIRVRVGPISLGFLRPGEIRPLSQLEIKALKSAVGLSTNPSPLTPNVKGKGLDARGKSRQ